MSGAWAFAAIVIVLIIGVTVVIVSDRWADLTGAVIENNVTMMCKPVDCNCNCNCADQPYYWYYDDWNLNNSGFENYTFNYTTPSSPWIYIGRDDKPTPWIYVGSEEKG